MKKMILIFAGTVLVLGLGVVGYFWFVSGKGSYQPGKLAFENNLAAPLSPPVQPNEPDYWTVEPGVSLFHFAEGQGRNVLIVHGGPGMPYADPWPGLAPLAERYTFHYYDQRGAGESTRPIDSFESANYFQNAQELERALGLGTQLADIERVRQLLGDERLILIGHSYGAFLATLYAVEFPEHVAALVLVAPADLLVMPPASGGLFPAVAERLPPDMIEEYNAYLKDYLDFSDLFSKTDAQLAASNAAFGRFYATALNRALPEQSKPGGWMVQAMYLSMGQRHDYREALSRAAVPALVVRADNDLQLISVEEMYVQALPDANLAVIENAGHFVFLDQPDAFAVSVGSFLSAVP